MKLKSTTMILTMLLFAVGITEFIMILMKFKLPTTIKTIPIILLFSVGIFEFIETRKLRRLAYPLIIIYFFVGMPIIRDFICNRILYIGFTILGFVITIIFIYKDLVITNKEKNLLH